MTPFQFRASLECLRWSQRGVAEALGCDDRLVRRWAAGQVPIPAVVAEWLDKAARWHAMNPPPQGWQSRGRAPGGQE